jgi:hypothetical protein
MKRITSVFHANFHPPQLSTIHLRKNNKRNRYFTMSAVSTTNTSIPSMIAIIASSHPAVSLMVSGPRRQL